MTWPVTDSPGRTSTPAGLAFLLLFFVSGFAALVYQVVWQRMLTFFGGADVYSVTIIVAAFMGGLGFGNLAGGHVADRIAARHRLPAFALCEAAVGLFALFSTTIYYDLLYVQMGTWASSRMAMAATVFTVTLWPTFFMGMSLPLLARALTLDPRQPARWIPLLYGSNTVGAACGSLFAAAILFRTFDFVSNVRLGAALSFICAAGALVLAPHVRRAAAVVKERLTAERAAQAIGRASAFRGTEPDARPRPPARFALRTWVVIYALSGFVALSLEIVWFRVLGVILKSNSFTFGHLLAVYLLGVGAGALLANHRRAAAWPAVPAFFLLQSAIPVVAAVSLALMLEAVGRFGFAEPLWRYLGEYEPLSREALLGSPAGDEPTRRGLFLVLYGVVPVAMIGLPTLMMGLSFGYLQRAVQTDLVQLGRRVGWLQTANIAGSMLGAMATGLYLLDWFGTAGTFRLLVASSAVFLVLFLRTLEHRRARAQVMGSLAIVGVLVYALPAGRTLWARLHGARSEEIIHGEDSSGLAVLKSRIGSHETIVHANGLGQGRLPFGGTHTVLGSLPALVHPSPKTVAVIGLGSGDTVFGIAGRSDTTSIDSIEIIAPELATLRRLDEFRHYPGLRMLLQDGRVRHWFTDGRAFIKNGNRRYDIIEADALRPTSAYAGNLFSVEYFELLRGALNPGGLAVTWTPTPRVVDSFVAVFPHVVVFRDLALGSLSAIPFDPDVVRSRMTQPFTRDYYQRGGVDLETLLRPYLHAAPTVYGPEFDRRLLVDLNRDLFPKDEFAIGYTGR